MAGNTVRFFYEAWEMFHTNDFYWNQTAVRYSFVIFSEVCAEMEKFHLDWVHYNKKK